MSATDRQLRIAMAEALRDARDALYRGEGPDIFDGADDVYADWLGRRADRVDVGHQ